MPETSVAKVRHDFIKSPEKPHLMGYEIEYIDKGTVFLTLYIDGMSTVEEAKILAEDIKEALPR
jgi:hypothetical protein